MSSIAIVWHWLWIPEVLHSGIVDTCIGLTVMMSGGRSRPERGGEDKRSGGGGEEGKKEIRGEEGKMERRGDEDKRWREEEKRRYL